MGSFDTVNFRCPECGGPIGVQSKAGDQLFHGFSSFDVPVEIAGDIDGGHVQCGRHSVHDGCGAHWRVRMDSIDRVPCTLIPGGHCKDCGTELEPDVGGIKAKDPSRWFKWWCPECEVVR